MNAPRSPALAALLIAFLTGCAKGDRAPVFVKVRAGSIAFINGTGQVINLADMVPLDEQPHCATGVARFALEVNHELLTAAGIRAGSSIGGLPRGTQPLNVLKENNHG